MFTDAAGEVAGTSGTPLAWDAEVDAQRLHPVAEPWTAEGELDTVMAEMPDWSAGEASPASDTPPSLGSSSVPPLPSSAAEEQPADAGQVASPAAGEAGASVGLPLVEAAEVVAPDVVELALTPDESFLQDPDTVFPVVVDPEYSWSGMFDTFVQHGFSTDQSGSTELRIGTYDGGTTVARSFLTLNVGSWAARTSPNATLHLANFYSATVQRRAPGRCGTPRRRAPRHGSTPSRRGTTAARGPADDDGRLLLGVSAVGLHVDRHPVMVQHWANASITNVGIGLKAASETDSTAWKKFFSAQNGSGIPTLWVKWNTPPGSATDLSVSSSPAPLANPAQTNDATPRLYARARRTPTPAPEWT